MTWERHELGGRPLFVRAPADRSRTYPAVYVLHAFEKRTRQTAQADIELASKRLAAVLQARRGR